MNHRLRKQIEDLKEEIHQLNMQIKNSKKVVDDTPCILDEPIYYNNTDYDPYNTVYENQPITISDINSQDINNIITYYGLGCDEWKNMCDIEKVNLYNDYQTKSDK